MSPVDPTATAGPSSLSRPEQAAPERSRERLAEAARRFEALFVEQLLKQMRDAQLESGFFGAGAGSDVYEGLFLQNLAEHVAADSPLGIAELLERQWAGRLADGAEQTEQALREAEALRARGAYVEAIAETPGAGLAPAGPGIQVPRSGADTKGEPSDEGGER